MAGWAQAEDLSRKRCFNHALRGASARCPRCARFFCRECVTEHEGRVLCTGCLAQVSARRSVRGHLLTGLLRTAAALVGLLAAMGFFHMLGGLLLRLPTAFHEGTLWAR